MIQVAVAGCAHIHTPGFVKRLKVRPDVKVTKVWDPDATRAEKTAHELEAQVVEDPAAIWSDADIEAAVICSETNRHEELVLAGAAAGKHLFVEKPLGFGGRDAWKMAAAIRRAGVRFQTGYFQRGLPVHQFLKAQLDAGNFGIVTRARHSNCHQGSLGGWFDTEWRWMADPTVAGCGAFGDLGTHSLDILMWWFGDVKRVASSIRSVTGRYGDCDESGEGLIEFENGVVATLAGGWVDVANPVRLLISGTEGHACLLRDDLYFQSSKVPGADGKTPWKELPPEWPHAFELFLDAVGGADVPLVSPHEAAARNSVMDALYRASGSGRWMRPKRR